MRTLILSSLCLIFFSVKGQISTTSNSSDQFYYDFHPLSTLSLGKTFDPNHLGDAKIAPINFIEKRVDINKSGTAALFSNFDIYMVSNKEELRWAFSFDSKVSARAFKMSGSSEMSLLNTFEFNKSSIYLVINAKSEYSRTLIDEITFTDLAQKFINKPKRFEEIFGSRIVTMVRKGIAIWIVVSIDNASYNLLNKLRYNSSASGKFGPLKGSASMEIKNELFLAQSQNRINLQIISNGGKGIGSYDEIIKKLSDKTTDFESLKKSLAESIFTNLTIDEAAPIGFHTTSIKSLGVKRGWKIKDKVVSSKFEKCLLELGDLYLESENQISNLNKLVNGTDPKAQLLNAGDFENIKSKYIPSLASLLVKISDLHTLTLFEYDDITEADYENTRNFDKDTEFLKRIEGNILLMRKEIEKNYPEFPSRLSASVDDRDITITCLGAESLTFNVYYEKDNQTKNLEFSNMCYKFPGSAFSLINCQTFTDAPDKFNTKHLFGRFINLQMKKEELINSITNHVPLFAELLSSMPSDKQEFDLYMRIKSPYIRPTELLIGKVYYNKDEGNTTIKNVVLFSTIVVPNEL